MLKPLVEMPKKNEQILISALWSNPTIYSKLKSHKIIKKTFVTKSMYIYYKIGLSMFESGINEFDKISVYTFLDKRESLKEEFELAGGFETISDMIELLKLDDLRNIEHHIGEILKFQALRELYDDGLIDSKNEDNLKILISANINEVKLYLNHKISKSLSSFNTSNYEIYDLISDELYDVIDETQEGVKGAIPFYHSSNLNRLTKGWQLGKLYYLIMPSGLGKSTFARNIFLPSIIENKQNALIFINEETKSSWQMNLLVTVANLKYRELVSDDEMEKYKPIFKERILSGGFNQYEKEMLQRAAKWLIDNQSDFIIKIVALKSYKFSDVVRIVEEHKPYNISTLILDTFKPTVGNRSSTSNSQRWEQFAEDSQELYDTIKAENMNIRCLATAQMKIGYRDRYLGLDSTGKSKEIVEVGDVVMLCREVFEDEYPNGINELEVFKWKEKENYNPDKDNSKWEKQKVELHRDKNYIIMFFGKNRWGSPNEQIIYEVNHDKNIIYEVGICYMRKTSG